jgi:hypothetical protein
MDLNGAKGIHRDASIDVTALPVYFMITGKPPGFNL